MIGFYKSPKSIDMLFRMDYHDDHGNGERVHNVMGYQFHYHTYTKDKISWGQVKG